MITRQLTMRDALVFMQSRREDTLEERYAVKFCFKLGKNATETYGKLQTAFGASCMNRAPASLEPHHHIVLCHMQDIHLGAVGVF